jgi:dTDP-4-amino-4,6-dideoxygalactose transaminase
LTWRDHLWRLHPGGDPIALATCLDALKTAAPERALREGLQRDLGAKRVSLHHSGREALRVALVDLAERTGRSEVVIPAYTCFSVAAASVAAGLRVRVVDVDLRGRIDAEALRSLPLERAAGIVICNLFGIAERVSPILEMARSAGALVVDDAAQALGARSAEGPVGGRADVGVLSFGRGKPLSGLGGGALAWLGMAPPGDGTRVLAPRRFAALARASVYNLALVPWVFHWLAVIPALGIGETRFDPGFPQGGIDGASPCLAAAGLRSLERINRERSDMAKRLAKRLSEQTEFKPLCGNDTDIAVYPRLGIVAPSPRARDAALRALRPFGATQMYPTAIPEIEALHPHLAGEPRCPVAHEFATRLLTLPTHAGLREGHMETVVGVLGRLES